MSIKQFMIKIFKLDIPIVHTIKLTDYCNSDFGVRASGRTTRLADMYIQLLFTTGRILIVDHWQGDKMSRYLRDIIIRRLKSEHPGLDLEIRNNEVIMRDKWSRSDFCDIRLKY